MFVKDWMRKKLITINANDTILDAVHQMRDHNIRRLPVVDGTGKLVGIITEKDVKEFSPSRASTLDIYEMHAILAKSTVKDAMNANVISARPDDPIEKVALMLRNNRIGGVPVINEKGDLVGIITAVDVFDVFVEAMGMRTPGARISIYVEDRAGAIAEMAKIVKQHDLNIISLATFYFKDRPDGFRDVVMRVSGSQEHIDAGIKSLEDAGFNITSILNMTDIISDAETNRAR